MPEDLLIFLLTASLLIPNLIGSAWTKMASGRSWVNDWEQTKLLTGRTTDE